MSTTLTKAHLEIVRGASKEPSRYAINGMHVSPDGLTETTDGKKLIRLEGVENPPEEGIILDAKGVLNLAKNVKKDSKYSQLVPSVKITADKEVVKATHESEGNQQMQTVDIIEGTFPKTINLAPLQDIAKNK